MWRDGVRKRAGRRDNARCDAAGARRLPTRWRDNTKLGIVSALASPWRRQTWGTTTARWLLTQPWMRRPRQEAHNGDGRDGGDKHGNDATRRFHADVAARVSSISRRGGMTMPSGNDAATANAVAASTWGATASSVVARRWQQGRGEAQRQQTWGRG